jgi:hypothetical protein
MRLIIVMLVHQPPHPPPHPLPILQSLCGVCWDPIAHMKQNLYQSSQWNKVIPQSF